MSQVMERWQTPERQEYMREWYEEHKEDRATYMREYYLRNKQKFIEKAEEWRRENIDKARKNVRERMRAVRHTPEGRAYQRKIDQMMREKYPKRRAARDAVNKAIKDGVLIRPEYCELCKMKCPIHAHHPDYSKQLEVQWLCVGCHNKVEKEKKCPKKD